MQTVVRSNVDLFSFPSIESSYTSSTYIDYFPITPLDDSSKSSVIEFNIGSTDSYISLDESFIYLKFKIVKYDGSDLTYYTPASGAGTGAVVAAGNNVAVSNLIGGGLFSQVDLYINEQLVTSNSSSYAYKNYLEKILNFSKEYLDTQGILDGYIHDDSPDSLDETVNSSATGFKLRRLLSTKPIEICTRPSLDLFSSGRLLLNYCNIRVKFTLNKPDFYLMSPEPTPTYKIKFLKFFFRVKKVILQSDIVLQHLRLLKSGRAARYPIKTTSIKTYTIPSGFNYHINESVLSGVNPERILIGFVESSAFNGNYGKNPYNFKHFDVDTISLFTDNNQVIRPIVSELKEGLYALPFKNLFEKLGMSDKDVGSIISPKLFKEGLSLFLFDLNSSSDLDGTFVAPRQGNVRIEITFKTPLTHVINVILMLENQAILNIDSGRSVYFTDFKA